MKRDTPQKAHRNFKLAANLDKELRRQAAKLKIPQTQILEAALRQYLFTKS